MNIAIIGLGTIAEKYINAIENFKAFQILAICDLNETPLKKRLVQTYPSYQNYELIPKNDLDFVFILTPPETHFDIASYFLNQKIRVFLEKPATKNLKDLRALRQIAKANQVLFDCIFHWKYGVEVLFLKKHKDLILGFDDLYITVYDPYYKKGIKENKVHLGGAWLDSGINALSFLSLFFNINQLKLIDTEVKIDEASNLDYHQKRVYDFNGARVTIEVIWDDQTNHKSTTIYKENQKIEICHSLQMIKVDDKIIFKDDHMERLTAHYFNFFKQMNKHKTLSNQTYKIHKKTFENPWGKNEKEPF